MKRFIFLIVLLFIACSHDYAVHVSSHDEWKLTINRSDTIGGVGDTTIFHDGPVCISVMKLQDEGCIYINVYERDSGLLNGMFGKDQRQVDFDSTCADSGTVITGCSGYSYKPIRAARQVP